MKESLHHPKPENSFLRFAMEKDLRTGKPIYDKDGKPVWNQEWKDRLEHMHFQKNGLPTVFFHATYDLVSNDGSHKPHQWTHFESKYVTDAGFHFGTAYVAENYSDRLRRMGEEDDMEHIGERTIPVISTMETPLRVEDDGGFQGFLFGEPFRIADGSWRDTQKQSEDGLLSRIILRGKPGTLKDCDPHRVGEVMSRIEARARDFIAEKDLKDHSDWNNELEFEFNQRILEEFGYDGIVYANTNEGKGANSIMVLDKRQLFSALTGEPLWK